MVLNEDFANSVAGELITEFASISMFSFNDYISMVGIDFTIWLSLTRRSGAVVDGFPITMHDDGSHNRRQFSLIHQTYLHHFMVHVFS